MLKGLGLREKITFRFHLAYSVIEGIILGALALNEFVFIKSLRGDKYQLAVLFAFSMAVFLFLIVFNQLIGRMSNKRRLLRITALITRGPLAILAFLPATPLGVMAGEWHHFMFLGIFLVYFMGNPIIYPTINLLLKKNYRHERFGSLYSYATTVNKIVLLIVTFGYGVWLDYNNFAFIYVYPAIALLGVASVSLLSLIPLKPGREVAERKPFKQSVKDSVMRMFLIVRDDKPYRHFEIGFMFYGVAFMISYAVITLYYDRALGLNYSSVAFYKNAYNILAILMLPFFGKLLGKIDPRKFAAITFGSMLLYIFFLALAEHMPAMIEWRGIRIYYILIPYLLFHGVFAATMSLLWSIGSAYFCKPEEAADYQAVHLSLTGTRALAAPLAGMFVYELAGFSVTFTLTMALLGIGIFIMFRSYRRDRVHR